MWRDEPLDDPCDAPDGWETLPPCLVGAPTDDDLDFATVLAALDDGPWHAPASTPCPVCGCAKPAGATSCGDVDCVIYAGAIVLVRLDEPFGGEPMAAE